MFDKAAYNREYSRKWQARKKAERMEQRPTFCPYCEKDIESDEFARHFSEHEASDPEFFADINKHLARRKDAE